MNQIASNHIVVTSTKSVGIALLLTFFLGPIGLLYATVRGTLCLIGAAVLLVIAISILGATAGLANPLSGLGMLAAIPLLLFLLWLSSIVWAVVAVNAYNHALMNGVRS